MLRWIDFCAQDKIGEIEKKKKNVNEREAQKSLSNRSSLLSSSYTTTYFLPSFNPSTLQPFALNTIIPLLDVRQISLELLLELIDLVDEVLQAALAPLPGLLV